MTNQAGAVEENGEVQVKVPRDALAVRMSKEALLFLKKKMKRQYCCIEL